MKTKKKTKKNYYQKWRIWIATFSILSVGAIVAAPLAIMYLNKDGDTPPSPGPDPEPPFDPIDKDAYKLSSMDDDIVYGDIDGYSCNGLWVQKEFNRISIVLKKENFVDWGGISGFIPHWQSGLTTITMKYIEFGESIIDKSSSREDVGNHMFTSSIKVTDAMVVFHNQVGTLGKKGLIFVTNDPLLHSNKEIYLDIDLKNAGSINNTDLPFADGEVPTIKIYINKNRGDKVEDWAKLLNIDPKYIIETWTKI